MIKIQMVSGNSVFIENATHDYYKNIMDDIFYKTDPMVYVGVDKFVLVRNIEIVEYIEKTKSEIGAELEDEV